jgi:hypothetical protein
VPKTFGTIGFILESILLTPPPSPPSCLPACMFLIVSSTKTVYKDLNPTFDEFFEVGNLPSGTSVLVEVRMLCSSVPGCKFLSLLSFTMLGYNQPAT